MARRDLQRIGNIEQSLKEQAPASMFYVDEDVSCHTGLQRERFLGEALLDAQGFDPVTNLSTPVFPRLHTLGIVLARSGGHAAQ